MIAGDFAAYFLGLLVEYEWGLHASLIVFLALYFLFLWVSLAACGVGDKTKSGNTKYVLVGRRIWTVATERATRLRQNQAGRGLQIYHLSFSNLSPVARLSARSI